MVDLIVFDIEAFQPFLALARFFLHIDFYTPLTEASSNQL